MNSYTIVSQSTSCTLKPSAKEQHKPFPLARRSNHGLSGEFANRPSSRATSWSGTSIVVRQNAWAPRLMNLPIVASLDQYRVSDQQTISYSGHPSIDGHRGAFLCEQLGYVSHAPLGLSFNGSLWFCRQLQNRGLLALTQCCQQHDSAIRQFQRIVMRCDLVFIDLPKDRCLMVDNFIAPSYHARR